MTGLTEVLDCFFAAKMETVHTVLPGTFTAYEGHETRRATVQPGVRLELGTGPVLDIPPIAGVPVLFPSTSEFSLLFEPKPGDGCLILFSEAGMGRWLAGKGELNDPDDQTRHALTDAIAIPGLWPFNIAPKTKAPKSGFWLGFKDTSIELQGDSFTLVDGKGNSISSLGTTLTLNGSLEVDQ